MNPSLDIEFTPSVETPDKHRAGTASQPANWREALVALVAARLALIELEFKQAARAGTRRVISLAAVAVCVLFTWALLLAGGIAVIAQAAGLPWPWIAIGAAVLHLIAAICFARAARAPAAPAFPVTRAEFQKDREWIENLKQTPKSNG